MQIQILPMNPKDMFRKEAYTDGKSGTIFESIPVFIDPETQKIVQDPMRTIQYEGQCYIQGQPLGFMIPAQNLSEAIERFAAAMQGKIEELQSQAIQQRIAQPGVNGKLLIDQPSRKR